MDIRSKFFLSDLDIVDVVRILDDTASMRTGENIFLGMKRDTNSSYENVSEITNIDKETQEIIADQIISKLDQMYKDNINPITCAANLDKFVTNLIIDNHAEDEKVIKGVFGTSFVKLSKKELIQVENVSVEYCGAGSCGIQRTEQSSTQAYSAKKSGLKGEIGYFAEGLCSVCKNVGFYVGDNGKYCDNCKSKDLIS